MDQCFYLEEAVLDVHVADGLRTDSSNAFEHLEAGEHRRMPQVGDGTPGRGRRECWGWATLILGRFHA
jgi:hypothetical protein